MDKSRLYDLVSRLPRRTFIRLIGAEPTLRDDLHEIVREIKSRGHHVSLTTNGLKLHRMDYVQKLKSAGLRLVLISMNGGEDDEVYKRVDGGKYAVLKNRALDNCMKSNLIVNTGTIVLKDCNEHVIPQLYQKLGQYKSRVKPVMRLRTMAPIGRHMGEEFIYDFEEFRDRVCQELGITNKYIEEHSVDAFNNYNGVLFDMPNCIVRMVDWTVDDDGVPDNSNESRGRITQDFKLAPFFEHVKENEYGY
tara:strand:+ start:339 stop:1085 length:747 start_codon:yes stop_codon:yes gene_type:complete